VRKGCVAAFVQAQDGREQLVVVAKVRNPKCLPDARDLQQRVLERLGIAIDVVVFIRGRTFAKTSSGKIARHLVNHQLMEGKLEIVSRVQLVTPIDAEPGLNTVGSGVLPVQHSGFEAVLVKFGLTGREPCSLLDAGIDSIRLVELSQDLKMHLAAQGHEHLAETVDLRVLQKISISELNDLLVQLAVAAPQAKARFRKALSDLRHEQRELERAMMRRDTRLRFDPAHLPVCAKTMPAAPSGVLLTGGTGFFGPFLLASLLRQTSDPIYVLVRADSEPEGRRRLLAGLAAVLPVMSDLSTWDMRIRPVCGDLSRVNLGLPIERWNALAESVHTIFHNGAQVNYLLDYATMRDVNVGGTNELVRLAMSHRAKVFNHISTTFVFGWSVKDILYESDSNADMDLLDFGYSQSKWVSEQVVFAAMKQGLKARVFRPALITPSLDGGGCNLDISIRLLAFMLNQRIGTSAQNQVSFTPADLAADNIVAISQLPDSIDQTYHVTRDTYTNMVEITRILGELTEVRFTNFALADFVPEVIERCRPGDVLFPLLDFFVQSAANITAMEFKRYDNRHYAHARDSSRHGKADPPLRDVILGILRYMRRQGVVTA
jgi:thioester reductase-like protein